MHNTDGALHTIYTASPLLDPPGWGYRRALSGEPIVYELQVKEFIITRVQDLPPEYDNIY